MSSPGMSASATRGSQPIGFARATWLVAKREIIQRGKDKSFGISFLITLAIVLVIIGVQAFNDGEDTYDVGLVDAAGISVEQLQAQATTFGVQVEARMVGEVEAVELVRGGELDAALTAPSVALVDEELDDRLAPVLQAAERQAAGARNLAEVGIDPIAVEEALSGIPFEVSALDPPDEDADERQAVATIGTFLLYGQLIGYAMWVALGVVEEKASRVVEVLLAAVPARALLAGKVLGIGILGLGQLLLVALIGTAAAIATDTISASSNAVVPIALVLGWFLLGYAFYATAFAAASARVSRQEDIQNVTTPLTLVIVASFVGALWAQGNEDSTLARVLAVAPPISGLVNPARVATGSAEPWEAPVAIALMLLSIAVLVVLGARLYERAVLHSGSVLSWRGAWAGDRAGKG